MSILNKVRQWQEKRDAIPTQKIKTLGLIAGSVRRMPTLVQASVREVGSSQQPPVERAERRIDFTGIAMLIGRHGRLGVEQAMMQNVSSRGARIISMSEWYADDTILVSLPAEHFTSAARVAYCKALGTGQFAIGLEFVGANATLNLSTLALLERPESRSQLQPVPDLTPAVL